MGSQEGRGEEQHQQRLRGRKGLCVREELEGRCARLSVRHKADGLQVRKQITKGRVLRYRTCTLPLRTRGSDGTKRRVSSELILVVAGTLRRRGHGESQEKAAPDFTAEVPAACVRGAGGDGETRRDPGGIWQEGLLLVTRSRGGSEAGPGGDKADMKAAFRSVPGRAEHLHPFSPGAVVGVHYHPV